MSLFTIYSSSAGSGKTFTLTKEYLKLVLRADSPLYFQKILAMTFTNDAAEEMKKRIIGSLKSLSDTGTEKDTMFNELIKDLPQFNESEIKEKAGKILHEILHNYNDFAIKTIDSFVNQIVSSFTFDLNLPYNYEIILDTNEIIAEAVRNLIDRAGRDQEITLMLKEFALEKVDDNKSWNMLEKDIVEFGKEIFKNNNALEIEKNSSLTHENAVQINKNIRFFFKNEENKIKELATKALALMASKGLDENDFLFGKSGVYNFYTKLSKTPDELFKKDIPGIRVTNALNEGKWYKDKSPLGHVIDEIKADLTTLGNKIIALRTEKYQILKAINKNLLKVPFLYLIKYEIDTILSSRNEVILADFNRKILEVVANEPVPYIYERIGEKYNHILVDEFQDTSDIQFFNLLPLFENSIAKNFKNLIVGDPKQAIYSWRGGNVMLMLDLINRQPDYLQDKVPEMQKWQLESVIKNTRIKNLSRNYRSKEQIIAFNNELFGSIVKRHESKTIKQVFSDYIQLVPDQPKRGGYVAVEVLNKKETDFKEKIAETVSSILNDGYEERDIAFLCRKGSEGTQIAEILESLGYQINSTEVLKLKNNLAVKFLTSGLRFFLHPERQFERFEFLQFFFVLKNINTEEHDLHAICNLSPDDFLDYYKHFSIKINRTEGLNPYQLSEYLVEKFALLSHEKSTDYILRFLDFALEFTNRKSKNLTDFLNRWSIAGEKLSIVGQGDNAITINTIHKSKGLEYPIVIMPFVNWATTPKADATIWLGLDQTDYPELYSGDKKLMSAPFGYNNDFEFSKHILERERELLLIENLNLLYVALTRAEHRQYVWCWSVNNSFEKIGSHIYNFLIDGGHLQANETLIEFGEKSIKSIKNKIEKTTTSYSLAFPHVFSDETGLKIKKTEANEQVQEGNLIHSIFERIKYATEIESVLDNLVIQNLIAINELPTIKSKVDAVVNHEELKHLFRDTAVIKNEMEILSSHTNVKRPDRVIFANNEVYVLDYKTGKKATSHGKQLKEYANLLKQMGYSKIKLYLVYLEPLEVIPVN